MLLDAGANIHARAVEFQGTPLAAAVRGLGDGSDRPRYERGLRMIVFLLKRGAATNLPDDRTWSTPLFWARKIPRGDAAELLRHYGAR